MILTTDHGAVRELQFNRPPANALSPELIVALRQAVESAPSDGARALVLSGSAGRYSAGLDVPLLLTLDRPAIADLWRELYALLRALALSPIPIAAAITGHATAGGTVISIYCDYRVAAQGDWKLGLNEVQVGLPVPPVIFSGLRLLLGARQAERLAVGGLLISPNEAARIGLVDELVALDQVVSRAIEWSRGILALPVDAMARPVAALALTGSNCSLLHSILNSTRSPPTGGSPRPRPRFGFWSSASPRRRLSPTPTLPPLTQKDGPSRSSSFTTGDMGEPPRECLSISWLVYGGSRIRPCGT